MQPMRKSYHEWWGLPLFFLQKLQVMFGTKNNLPKGLAEKIELKKKKKKTYHYVLKMSKIKVHWVIIIANTQYKVYFGYLFLNYLQIWKIKFEFFEPCFWKKRVLGFKV
jgi:hypothetical protein